MKIPQVGGGKAIAICAHAKTGVVLHNDGSVYIGKGDDYYLIFDNLALARQYASAVKNTSSVGEEREVILYDDQGNFVELIA